MIIKTNPLDIISYCEDTSNLTGKAQWLYLPQTVKDAVEAVNTCVKENIPITLSSGRTGTTGGCVPQGGAIISLEMLTGIDWVDDKSGIIKVQAGVPLDQLIKKAVSIGYTLRALPTEKLARAGGIISTSASGVRGFGYGSIRQYVLGIDIVLISGEVIHIPRGKYFAKGRNFDVVIDNRRFNFVLPSYCPPQVKCQAGYFIADNMDLIDLFIGSEGTLGIIIAAEFQLHPQSWGIFDGLVFFHDEADAFAFVDMARNNCGPNAIIPVSLEFFDQNCLEFLKPVYSFIGDSSAAVYFEQEASSQDEFTKFMDYWNTLIQKSNALIDKVIFADTFKERDKLFEFRHMVPQKINEFLRKTGQIKLSVDIAVPACNFRTMYGLYRAEARNAGIRYVNFGHIGEFHLHFNFLPATDQQSAEAEKLIEKFCRKAVELGGTISAEHGIGKIKKKYLRLMYEDRHIQEMAAVKKYFDPYCLLNPDNILDKELLSKM